MRGAAGATLTRMASPGTWQVGEIIDAAPAALVAATEAAVDAVAADGTPRLRWYRATSTALVRGRAQARLPLSGAGVPVLDRLTGGGAVLLGPDLLSCDVIVPAGHPLAVEPMPTFDRVGAAWRDALAALGVAGLRLHRGPATAVPRGDARQRLLAAVCFATRARGEVLLGDAKLVGLAQRRRRTGVLVQCGLLRRWRPGPLLAALGGDADDPHVATAAVGLDDVLTHPPGDAAIADAVSERLARWRPTTGPDARRNEPDQEHPVHASELRP